MDRLPLYMLYGGGIAGPIVIGHVIPEIAHAIGARTVEVRVSREDIQKIRYKHRVLFEMLNLVPISARYGWAAVEPGRPRHVVFLYEDREIYGKPFKTVLKATNEHHQIFLETFHRTNDADIRRVRRRCTKVLRPHL